MFPHSNKQEEIGAGVFERRLLFKTELIKILFLSCSKKVSYNQFAGELEDKCSIVQTSMRQFVLDENTPSDINYLQYVTNDTMPCLTLLNNFNNSIYLYDALNGDIMDSIHFEKEGANGVGTIQGYYYHNDDSIFIYPYATGRVYMANRQSKVLQCYHLYNVDSVLEDTVHFLPVPFMETRLPMFYWNGRLMLSAGFMFDSSLEKKDNLFVCMTYKLHTGHTDFALPYPEVYRRYNWGNGEMFYRQPAVTMTDKGELLYSFPTSHEIWRYNSTTGRIDSIYAGSNMIRQIVPFSTQKEVIPNEVPGHVISEWYYSQPSYEGIWADPYKGFYYRIARLPNPNHQRNTFNDKPVIVIVLDSSLHYIGEERLPEGVSYDTFNCYVSNEGLHIHIRNSRDEDHLTFYTYHAEYM